MHNHSATDVTPPSNYPSVDSCFPQFLSSPYYLSLISLLCHDSPSAVFPQTLWSLCLLTNADLNRSCRSCCCCDLVAVISSCRRKFSDLFSQSQTPYLIISSLHLAPGVYFLMYVNSRRGNIEDWFIFRFVLSYVMSAG